VLLHDETVSADAFEARTGWAIKPEGACKDHLCVPLPAEARKDDGSLHLRPLAAALGMPVLEDDAHGLLAVGPATVGGRALETATAPDIELPDLDGEPFRLSSLHGKKVLLVAWASW
jgi:hypothetical protein